jgi:protein-L-isoaspartate(D-aspartate) O-methyltransferase
MVRTQIERRGIRDAGVLAAMRAVPRHNFMPPSTRALAYGDHPVSIGESQTISQPYIVALMTELAGVKEGSKVLEIGTGSGYQAAVLAQVGCDVYSIEIIEILGKQARQALDANGYRDVHTRIGDGYQGWPEEAPFDAVVITAAPPEVPPPLLEQLAVGGRLVAPVGAYSQDLVVITRTEDGYKRRSVIPVLFVPMTGEAQRR